MAETHDEDQGIMAEDLADDVESFPAPDYLGHLEKPMLLEANIDIKALRDTLSICLKFIETQARAIKKVESMSKLLDQTNTQLAIQVGKVLDITGKYSPPQEKSK